MKIEVKPLSVPKWHGKTGKDSFTRPKTLNVLIDPVNLQYATGLNYEDKVFDDPEGGKVKLTEAQYYERLLNVDLSPQFIEGRFHSFWDSKTPKVKLENRTMFFDTNNPIEYIRIKIMKASKFVANSMREWEEGLYPYATHVITDEAEEVQVKASKVALKTKARLEGTKLTPERKAQLVMILDGKNVKGKSVGHIDVAFDELVEKKANEILDLLTKTVDEVATQSLVREALQKNVLRKVGHKIMYNESELGMEEDEVAAKLLHENNQDLKIRLIAATK